MNDKRKIILASQSPRRKELLQMLGLKFNVVPSNIDEKLNPRLQPASQAEQLSLQKAQKIAEKHPDALIIAADTFVTLNKEILGKPSSIPDAKKMLEKLSGKTHMVITGFTIIDTATNKIITKSSTTKVSFRKISTKEIDAYVKREHVLDKSGSYAIQGPASVFVEKIEGEFFNIVGLPLYMIVLELKRFGIQVL